MKFYAKAVVTGKPARAHKNRSVWFVIVIEIGNRELLVEGRGEIQWRRKICTRQCAFETILRTELGYCEYQRSCHHHELHVTCRHFRKS